MKKLITALCVLTILFGTSTSVFAVTEQNKIPEEVQKYAAAQGFSTFQEVSPMLGFSESIDLSRLLLAEGFPVYLIKNDPTSNSLGELLDSPHKWTFYVNTADGETIGHLEVVQYQDGLTSYGGGQDSYVSDSVQKMRELIQKYGEQDDPMFVEYSITGRLLYYSFGGDERVLDLTAVAFDQIKLDDITDYRQLPTAQEALDALKKSIDLYQQEIEKNGGQPLYGGVDLNLSLGMPSKAAESYSYTDFHSLYDHEEAGAVTAVLSQGILSTAEELINPYKLYSMIKSQFLEMIEAPEAKLADLNDYLSLVPLKDGTNRKVRLTDGAWQVIGGRTASIKPSQEDIDMSTCFELLNQTAAVSEAAPNELTIYAVEVADLATSFLICVTAEEAFAIPFSDASHLTHLESGKLYTLKEVGQILQMNSTSPDPVENGQSNGGSAMTPVENEAPSLLPYLGGAVLVVISLIICFTCKRKNKNNVA